MAAAAPAAPPAAVPALDAAWELALAGWDEPPRHAAILALAAQHRAFAWAAARYRERLALHPGDPIATGALARINKAALATMYATATQKPEPTVSRQTVMVLVLGVLTIIILSGVFLLSKLQGGGPDPRVKTTPAKARRL